MYNYQTRNHLKRTESLIIITVIGNRVGTIAIFLSNILLLMNNDCSANKPFNRTTISFQLQKYFILCFLVLSVAANFELTPCIINGLHITGVGGISKVYDTGIKLQLVIKLATGHLNRIISFSSACLNVYNIL